MGMSLFGRDDDGFVVGSDPAQCDVVPYRALEEEHVLRNECDRLAQRSDIDACHVGAIDPHCPVERIVEPLDQADDGRLAAARRADKSRRLVGLSHKIEFVENQRSRPVAE